MTLTRPAEPEEARERQRIVDEHYEAVFRFCVRCIGSRHAEDATQECFLIAVRRWHEYRGLSSVRTWLFGIARNVCRNLARDREDLYVSLEIWKDTTPSREDAIVDRLLLREALAGLSFEQREAIVLHELEGLNYSQIAELLGIPEGTVKSRVHYAFQNLRRAVRPKEEP